MTKIVPINPTGVESVAPQKTSQNHVVRPKPGGVEFSKHLMERINRRKLKIGPKETQQLNDAMNKAEAKGSKDSLVLLKDLAFIVSVQNRKVVTAMDKNKMNEGVFTNIDSAIIM
jgi:flagellar operon protein